MSHFGVGWVFLWRRCFIYFFQTFIRDTQTGLRGIKWTELGHLVTVPGDHFDFEANMLIDMALRERPYAMVEIDYLC